MPKEYTKEEWWKLYERLPDELKRALFSADNAQALSGICKRYEILDKTSEIAKYLGRILLGVLPFDEFQDVLREEIKLEEKIAKGVFHDIRRFIFFPVKGILAQLYEMESPEAKPAPNPPSPGKEDVYREPIE